MPGDPSYSADAAPYEYPTDGCGDMRYAALRLRHADGSEATELFYESHRLLQGKPALPGLPHTHCPTDADAQTLQITLADPIKGVEVMLSYTLFEGYEGIVRSASVRNRSAVDWDCGAFEEIHLHGSWARERHMERGAVTHGIKLLESRRGASSHSLSPFFALVSPGTGEEHGEAWGFSLVYSGNWAGVIEQDQYASTRALMGISDHQFAWRLNPCELFQSPEVLLVYSGEGLGAMSDGFHRLIRDRLCRSAWTHKPRPVLVNNWEATYFDFDEAKLVSLAAKAASLGIELLVMDDGWFGRRNDDHSSLGDWVENREKLPGGLPQLVRRVREQGVEFGIWFEPEMISPDSDLYRAHPDWCMHIPGRRQTRARDQLVLDTSRADVCDHLIETLSGILRGAPIAYVKWDFNRNLTEVYSANLGAERQGEVYHRFQLGTYRVLEALTTRFPEILFEGCSGGGGRFDAGMLYYTPQIWTSDDTDAVERIRIQYGTSLAYPLSAMGAHVSVTPNHQTGRVTPFALRGLVAMTGAFGYELDLERLSDEDCASVRTQVEQYHAWAALLHSGRLRRLRDPFRGEDAAWMVVSADGAEALVFYFLVRALPNAPLDRLRLSGLDAQTTYADDDGNRYTGAQLMGFGLPLDGIYGDYQGKAWHLRRVE
jgi:alpha-galactosidase